MLKLYSLPPLFFIASTVYAQNLQFNEVPLGTAVGRGIPVCEKTTSESAVKVLCLREESKAGPNNEVVKYKLINGKYSRYGKLNQVDAYHNFVSRIQFALGTNHSTRAARPDDYVHVISSMVTKETGLEPEVVKQSNYCSRGVAINDCWVIINKVWTLKNMQYTLYYSKDTNNGQLVIQSLATPTR